MGASQQMLMAGGGAQVYETNLQLWLDVGNAASYSGSGADWLDLTSNGFDYFRGEDSGGTNGPTYNAGPPAYFSYNGTTNWNDQQAAYSGSIMRTLGRSNQPFTIEWWVYASANGYLQASIQAGGNNGSAFDLTGSLQLRANSYPTGGTLTASTGLTSATWTQLVFAGQYDGSTTSTFYKNAASAGSGTINNSWGSGDSDVTCGLMGRAIFGGFAGNGTRVAIVRIYDAILTQQQVDQNFQANRGRFGI